MLNNPDSLAVIILAAGQGKRMKSHLPKVMHLLKGKPIIDYIVSAVEPLKEVSKIIVVVSSKNNLIQEYLGERVEYSVQSEQKGTGDATLCAESLLGEIKNVIVMYGDLPCITSESLKRLAQEQRVNKNHITLMTTLVEDYNDWRAPFLTYGRIIRSDQGTIKEIVEYKDATNEQKNIFEVNSGVYCFQSQWLFRHLKNLVPNNAQGEYYLTDVVKMALEQGEKVSSVPLDPKEAIGVTTPEDLQLLSIL